MEMSGMEGGLGGMDMSSEGPFRPTNHKIALGVWYGIAGIVSVLTLTRIIRIFESRHRQRLHQKDPHCIPSRPRGFLTQAFATAIAILREISYSQPIYFTGRFSKYLSPLPLGRWLILAFYWVVLLCSLWSNTILSPSSSMYGYKWEIVAFRAGWVSVTQIPFIYLLSCKFNPISILTGISYERFNWLHRWAARTMFLTIIVHWCFFFREWSLADFVKLEIQMMPMVKYGFGAWAVTGWMVLSGFGFFRSLSYEVFVAQHICAAATLLWLLNMHIPSYAKYNVYMAIGFVSLDWSARVVWGISRNTHFFTRTRVLGYEARLEPLPGDMVKLTIENVDFLWVAGQHAYISVPRVRTFELHPFTIANAAHTGRDGQSKQLMMLIKAHSGFSRRLHKAATDSASNSRTYIAFLSGPWGNPPDLIHYETVILVACSSGATFVVPLLQDLVMKRACARKVVLHWIIRCEEHFGWFERDLVTLGKAAHDSHLSLQMFVHVTQYRINVTQERDSEKEAVKTFFAVDSNLDSSSSSSVAPSENEGTPLTPAEASNSQSHGPSLSLRYGGRPSIESVIRPAVEAAKGETAVVVCGGLAITAQTRTFVATLSDERAVHKGSGAQGIFVFTETYGW